MSFSTSSRSAASCSLACWRVKVSFSFCDVAWASWPLDSSSRSSSACTRPGLSCSRRRSAWISSSASASSARMASSWAAASSGVAVTDHHPSPGLGAFCASSRNLSATRMNRVGDAGQVG